MLELELIAPATAAIERPSVERVGAIEAAVFAGLFSALVLRVPG